MTNVSLAWSVVALKISAASALGVGASRSAEIDRK
jgi:hypothetical protein